MSDYGLTTQQLLSLCALSNGANMTAAAEQAGIHRNTINNWRRNSPPFQHGFAHAQYDRALYFREKIEERIDVAFRTLDEVLADSKISPSVRLKAALVIITTASTPPVPKKQIELDIEKIVFKRSPPAPPVYPAPVHSDAQPSPVPAPPTAATCPTPQTMHKDAQSSPAGTPDNPPSSAEIPANPPILHKDAQSNLSHGVDRRPTAAGSPQSMHNCAQVPDRRKNRKNGRPDVGRNTACPCGSGKKYKRCCLNKQVSDSQVSKESVQRLPTAA